MMCTGEWNHRDEENVLSWTFYVSSVLFFPILVWLRLIPLKSTDREDGFRLYSNVGECWVHGSCEHERDWIGRVASMVQLRREAKGEKEKKLLSLLISCAKDILEHYERKFSYGICSSSCHYTLIIDEFFLSPLPQLILLITASFQVFSYQGFCICFSWHWATVPWQLKNFQSLSQVKCIECIIQFQQ